MQRTGAMRIETDSEGRSVACDLIEEIFTPICPLCGSGYLQPVSMFGNIPFYACMSAGTAYVVTCDSNGVMFLTLFDPMTATVLFGDIPIARFKVSALPICVGITEDQWYELESSGSKKLASRIVGLINDGCYVFLIDDLGTPSSRLCLKGSRVTVTVIDW